MIDEAVMNKVIGIAQEAGKIALDYQRKGFETKEKTSTVDLVTEADIFLDNYIREELKKLTPDILIRSEENEEVPSDLSGDVWIVDPIDGTYDFVHGGNGWSILIGLASNGIPHAGVMYIPTSGKIYAAISGRGFVCLDDTDGCCDYAVTDCKHAATARIEYSMQTYMSMGLQKKRALSKTFVHHKGVDGVHFEDILLGNAEGSFFIKKTAGPRDVCAPAVLLQEAGGKITDLNGTNFDFIVHKEFGYISSNGHIHDTLTESIGYML